jgi:SOS-response transcriptional repressor LexA
VSKREEAESAVLAAIKEWETKVYGPSIRDLSEATGFGTGTIHELVVSLAEKKKITWTPNVARSVRIRKENE